jgi:hypothetical protein
LPTLLVATSHRLLSLLPNYRPHPVSPPLQPPYPAEPTSEPIP